MTVVVCCMVGAREQQTNLAFSGSRACIQAKANDNDGDAVVQAEPGVVPPSRHRRRDDRRRCERQAKRRDDDRRHRTDYSIQCLPSKSVSNILRQDAHLSSAAVGFVVIFGAPCACLLFLFFLFHGC